MQSKHSFISLLVAFNGVKALADSCTSGDAGLQAVSSCVDSIADAMYTTYATSDVSLYGPHYCSVYQTMAHCYDHWCTSGADPDPLGLLSLREVYCDGIASATAAATDTTISAATVTTGSLATQGSGSNTLASRTSQAGAAATRLSEQVFVVAVAVLVGASAD